ncbi:MAG: glycosyltransferase [Thermofilaceae archaeon]
MISVVIPTKDNEDTIEWLLDSLSKQVYRDFEVIVVDSSRDRTPEIATRYPFVKLIRVPPTGLNFARNAGIHAARGEIVTFTDGDCRTPPDWLAKIADFFQSHPEAAAVGGSVFTARELKGRLVADYYNEAIWPMMPIYRAEVKVTSKNFHRVRIPTGNNLAFRKSVLAFFLFDEGIKSGYDEVELLWRLCSTNYKVYATPFIEVEHFHTKSLKKMLKRAFNYGKGHYMFYKRHKQAPLARYGMLGALALYSYYVATTALAWFNVWQPLVLVPLVYIVIVSMYLVKGRKDRSFIYPVLDFIFYTVMAGGIIYGWVKRG